MTCDQARAVLTGAYTPSSAIALLRHAKECQSCTLWIKARAMRYPAAERKAMAQQFREQLLPKLLETLAADPEV